MIKIIDISKESQINIKWPFEQVTINLLNNIGPKESTHKFCKIIQVEIPWKIVIIPHYPPPNASTETHWVGRRRKTPAVGPLRSRSVGSYSD